MNYNFKKRAAILGLSFVMATGLIYNTPLTIPQKTTASTKTNNKYNVNNYGILTSYSGGSNVYIKANVSALNMEVFDNIKVTSFSVDSKNKYFKAADGVLYTKNGKKLVRYPSGRKGAFTVPGTVTSIAQNAFRGCLITNIQIPESVTIIGSGAFYQCNKLKTINIPSKIKKLGKTMFYNCHSLQDITLPAGLEVLGEYAFYGCHKLPDITLPSSLKTLQSSTFYGCKSLKRISIPDNIKYISYSCFKNCKSLEYASLGSGIDAIGESAFSGCIQLKEITIPDSASIIGNYAFKKCINLKDLTIRNGISDIGYGAFMGCTSLKNVKIPDSVYFMSSCAFYNCSNLEEVILSKQLNYIPDSAFSNCTSLENITLPSGITEIRSNAFSNCTSLKVIKIPQNVKSIMGNSFQNAGTAFSVVPSNKTFSSGNGVLYNADKTTLYKFPAYKPGNYKTPDSVTKISSYAFSYCQELDKVTIGEGVKKINKNAFNNSSIKELALPSTLKTLQNAVNEINTINLTNITIPEDNQYFSSVSGMLYSKDKSILYIYPSGRRGTVTFPDEATDLNAISYKNKASGFSVSPDHPVYSTDDGILTTKKKTKILAVPSAKTSYHMGSTIKDIYNLNFVKNYMDKLEKITVEPQNKHFSAKNGVLLNADHTKIILYPCAKQGSYHTPSTVTKIDESAFCYAKKLTELYIGKNVSKCNINLDNCTSLENIFIKEGDLRKFTIYNAGTLQLKKLVLPTSLVSSMIYGYKKSLPDLTIIGWTNTSAEKLAKKTGAKFISSGIVPKQIQKIKINAFVHSKRIKISWKRDPQVSGYEIYSDNKKFKDIPDNNITETSLYIGNSYGITLYIRAYKIQNNKKVYGKPKKINYYPYQ